MLNTLRNRILILLIFGFINMFGQSGGGGNCYVTVDPNTLPDLEVQSNTDCHIVINTVTEKQYMYKGSLTQGSRWVEIQATGDNLGDHTATQNINLNGNYLSGDGGNEGVFVDGSGNSIVTGNIDIGGITTLSGDIKILGSKVLSNVDNHLYFQTDTDKNIIFRRNGANKKFEIQNAFSKFYTTVRGLDATLPTEFVTLGQIQDGVASYWTKTGNDLGYNSGYVGIGTLTPTAKLSLRLEVGKFNPTYPHVDRYYGGTKIYRSYMDGNYNIVFEAIPVGTNQSALVFRAGDSEVFRATKEGEFGIGVIPNHKLDVDGNINISQGNAYKINGVNYLHDGGLSTNIELGTTAQDRLTVRNLKFKTDVTLGVAQDGYALRYNDATGLIEPSADVTAATVLGLTDTPTSYTGKGGYNLRVNDTEDGVEFVDNNNSFNVSRIKEIIKWNTGDINYPDIDTPEDFYFINDYIVSVSYRSDNNVGVSPVSSDVNKGGVIIYDISNPSQPISLYKYTDNNLVGAMGMYRVRDVLYVISLRKGYIHALDISDLNNITKLSDYQFDTSTNSNLVTYKMSVNWTGKYAYLVYRTTSNTNTNLKVLNIENPSAITTVQTIPLTGNWSYHLVAIKNKLHIGNYLGSTDVFTYNIDPTTGLLTYSDTKSSVVNVVDHIIFKDKVVFCGWNNKLAVFDVDVNGDIINKRIIPITNVGSHLSRVGVFTDKNNPIFSMISYDDGKLLFAELNTGYTSLLNLSNIQLDATNGQSVVIHNNTIFTTSRTGNYRHHIFKYY